MVSSFPEMICTVCGGPLDSGPFGLRCARTGNCEDVTLSVTADANCLAAEGIPQRINFMKLFIFIYFE